MRLKEKIKACHKILFHNKPISSLTVGIRLTRCDECEYNLKCDECAYKMLAEKEVPNR